MSSVMLWLSVYILYSFFDLGKRVYIFSENSHKDVLTVQISLGAYLVEIIFKAIFVGGAIAIFRSNFL